MPIALGHWFHHQSLILDTLSLIIKGLGELGALIVSSELTLHVMGSLLGGAVFEAAVPCCWPPCAALAGRPRWAHNVRNIHMFGISS